MLCQLSRVGTVRGRSPTNVPATWVKLLGRRSARTSLQSPAKKETAGVSAAIPRRLYPRPCREPHPGLPEVVRLEAPSLNKPNRRPIADRFAPSLAPVAWE